MAGAGYKLFNTGDVLTAAQVNTYLQEQTVMVFDDAAARTTALSGVLSEGMISYLKDTDAVEKYDGSSWVSLAGAASPLTTKGDLYTYSTTDARLAVGNNGETLVADSSTATGLKWGQAALTLLKTTTFTTASTVVEDAIFTSSYAKYFLTFDFTAASASITDLNFYFRASGTDTTTSYNSERITSYTTTVAGEGVFTGRFGNIATTYPTYTQLVVNLHNPQLARRTVWTSDGIFISNTGVPYQARYGGYQDSATVFDGLKVYPASGTISGTMRIYGYGN